MISPELLRRFPFFNKFNPQQLHQIAMLTDQMNIQPGEVLFEEGQPAAFLYFLLDGLVDLSYKIQSGAQQPEIKYISVGDINPGEIFAISSLIEPYLLNATARCTQAGALLQIDAKALRALMDKDSSLGYALMLQVAKATLERLAATRVQLAAAWA